MFKPPKIPKTPKGEAGYDNQRENIDPHVRTRVVNGNEALFSDSVIVSLDSRDSPTLSYPCVRVYSTDETEANDYIEMYHDQISSFISSPGTIKISVNNQLQFGFFGDTGFAMKGSLSNDELLFGVLSDTGNTIIITSNTNFYDNHDHGSQTNPTLFIHSITAPDTDNTQWLSLFHDQTDGNIETGSGDLYLNPAGDVKCKNGWSGTFTNGDGDTVTVLNGIITNVA